MNNNIQPRINMEQHKAYRAMQQQRHAHQQRHTAKMDQRHIENHVANQVAFGRAQQTQHKLNIQA